MDSIASISIRVFIVAVMSNYLWELAQAPLYAVVEHDTSAVFWHCFVASLGDGLRVMLVLIVGWIPFRKRDWFVQPGLVGYLVMFTTGLVLALLVESVAVHILDRWEYGENMPTLPRLGIGVVPILQMLILPPLVFWIASSRILRTL